MDSIRGKFKQMIFESDNGYKVGLFRVKEASSELEDMVNKTITFTGYFADVNYEDYYNLVGRYVFNERYGNQFQVSSYEREEPKGKDAVISFLSSSLIKGCGEKTGHIIITRQLSCPGCAIRECRSCSAWSATTGDTVSCSNIWKELLWQTGCLKRKRFIHQRKCSGSGHSSLTSWNICTAGVWCTAISALQM